MSPSVSGDRGVAFTPMSAAGRKRVKLIGMLVGVLVVLVIAGVAAIKVANSSRTPEAQVRQYLDLLAAGNATAATAMVDPGIPNDQRVFLTDDVMASASSLLVVEEVVADKNEDAETRQVLATMQVNGERFTRSFRVSEAKKTFGLLKNWKIQDAMVARVDVQADKVTHFSIGGEKMSVATLKEAPSSSIVLYPGVYTFTPEETGGVHRRCAQDHVGQGRNGIRQLLLWWNGRADGHLQRQDGCCRT